MVRRRPLIGILASTLFAVFFALLVAPVVGEFFVKWAEERGWYDTPSARVASMMEWLSPVTESWWFLVFLGFFGGATAVYWALEFLPKSPRLATSAVLEVSVYRGGRNAESIREENIGRWALVETSYDVRKQDGALARSFFHTFIILTFDVPIQDPVFRVDAHNMQLPPHEIKFGNERFALVLFEGALLPGTVIISVRARKQP
jgi:MFS family permease